MKCALRVPSGSCLHLKGQELPPFKGPAAAWVLSEPKTVQGTSLFLSCLLWFPAGMKWVFYSTDATSPGPLPLSSGTLFATGR